MNVKNVLQWKVKRDLKLCFIDQADSFPGIQKQGQSVHALYIYISQKVDPPGGGGRSAPLFFIRNKNTYDRSYHSLTPF